MKTRIVFCNHFARPDWLDGAEISLLQLMNVLPNDSFEKFLITPSSGEMPKLVEAQGIKTEIFPLSLMWTMGGLVDLDRTKFYSLQANLEFLLDKEKNELFRFKRFLREIKPQIILVNTSVNLLPAVIGKRLGLKVLWFVREYFRGQFEASGQILDQFSDRILVASNAMERLLATIPRLGPKVFKLPNFIDLSGLEESKWEDYRSSLRHKFGITASQIAIGFWGSISPQKGVEDFLIMARQLSRRYFGKVKFFIAGCAIKNEYLQSAMANARQLGIAAAVVFPGFFSHSQHFLPGMDIVVLPSRFTETFSRAAMDAMVYQKPVVAYEGGGIGDLVQHHLTGFLASKGRTRELGDYCAKLIEQPVLRERMGIAGRNRVLTHYSALKVLPALNQLLNS